MRGVATAVMAVLLVMHPPTVLATSTAPDLRSTLTEGDTFTDRIDFDLNVTDEDGVEYLAAWVNGEGSPDWVSWEGNLGTQVERSVSLNVTGWPSSAGVVSLLARDASGDETYREFNVTVNPLAEIDLALNLLIWGYGGTSETYLVELTNNGTTRVVSATMRAEFLYAGEWRLLGSTEFESIAPGDRQVEWFSWYAECAGIGTFPVRFSAEESGTAVDMNPSDNTIDIEVHWWARGPPWLYPAYDERCTSEVCVDNITVPRQTCPEEGENP